MQSPQMQDLDWQGFLGLEPDIGLSPLRSRYSDQSPPDTSASAAPQRLRPRNRNPRSCDLCRARKTACVVDGNPPCTTCRARGLECTFAKRRRGLKQQDQQPADGTTLVAQDGERPESMNRLICRELLLTFSSDAVLFGRPADGAGLLAWRPGHVMANAVGGSSSSTSRRCHGRRLQRPRGC